MVLVEYAAQPRTPADVESADLGRISDWLWQRLPRPGVAEPLVRPMGVVELLVLVQGVEQVSLIPDEGAVEQFEAAGLYPAFHDRVHPGHPDTSEHTLDASVGKDAVEQGRVFAVPVPDQELCSMAGVLQVHDQVAGSLSHPCRGWMRCRTEYSNSTVSVLDHREYVHPCAGECDSFEEVTGQQGLGLGAQETGRRGGAALRRRVDPGLVLP